jgi:hypothetical protein
MNLNILNKRNLLLLTFGLVLTITSCSDDDDNNIDVSVVDPVDETITIGENLAKSISYNTGMVPLFPEGMTYDYSRNKFLISSASTGAISLVDDNGNMSSFIDASVFGGNGTLGLDIDADADRLFAVSTNLQNPTIANLFIFTLSTGDLLYNVDLAALTGGLTQPNDVTIDAEGNAYVTNSDQGVIYKVDPTGVATIFFNDANYAPSDPQTETGFNGIVYHTNGYFVVSHYSTNTLYKVDVSDASISVIDTPVGFVSGGDGVALNGNELVVVNNVGVPFVSKFSSSDDFASVTLIGDTYATGDVFPTSAVNVGNEFMIGNSYFNFPAYGVNPTNYLITKANFNANARFSGSASELPRVNTPVMPFGYGTTYPDYFYTDCTTAISTGIPDFQGDWAETTVTIDGTEYPAETTNAYSERIEQCGDRILIVSSSVLHEVFIADESMFNGVNDANPMGQPVHSVGKIDGSILVLTPKPPLQLGLTLPDVTRELLQDDNGQDVLKFFNFQLDRIVYMTR